MASINKVFIMGHCGRDAEVRYLPSGQAVANVSIATSSKWKDRTSGELLEETQWHRVTFYDREAEVAGEYLKKGSQVHIEGRLKYGKYTDKDGVERNTTEIVCSRLTLVGGRSENGANHSNSQRRPASQGDPDRRQRDQDQYDERPQQPQRRNEYAEQRGRAAPRTGPQRPAQPTGGASGFDDMGDEDIPF